MAIRFWITATLFLMTAFIMYSLYDLMSMESMLIGMGLGITTSPIMMHFIRQIQQRRKEKKILNELSQILKKRNDENLKYSDIEEETS